MSEQATFRIAGEAWLVTGLAPEELGPWAGPAGEDIAPDVVIRALEDAGHDGLPGVDLSPVGRTDEGYILRDEQSTALVAPGLASAEVRGVREALPAGVRDAARLGAILRCLKSGGLALHASGAAWEGRAYVFAGPAGSGKTTAARNAAEGLGAEVFADDTVLLRRETGRACWSADGLPWEAGPTTSDRDAQDMQDASLNDPVHPVYPCSAPFPLGAVIQLERTERVGSGMPLQYERLTGARAAAAAVALPPEVLGLDAGAIVLAAARLAAEAPVFRAGLPEGPAGERRPGGCLCESLKPRLAIPPGWKVHAGDL